MKISTRRWLSTLSAATVCAMLAMPHAAQAQKAYPTPQAATEAFVDAVATNDDEARRTVLGKDFRRYLPDDVNHDDRTRFLAAWAKGRKIVADSPDRAHLAVGADDWTLPIPLVKGSNGWRFDVQAGAEEMRIRRIGRNELAAMQALLAYHDAQKEYAEADRNGDGVLEYAQRFASSRGKRDGLVWFDDPAASPLGPLYGDETKSGVYHGYRFRILKAQGPAARGGARDYVVKGRMTQGFAAIAWPADYGDSGIMSFIINHDGKMFQKDLGPGTDAAARAMTRFNPDKGWEPAAPAAPVATSK
jgi:hypothetical protein